MKMPFRLESAINKLYTAFHNNTLHPEYCHSCAVGNICDNLDAWQHLTDSHGSLQLNYVGIVNQKLGKKINGYTPLELLQTEAAFLSGCGYELPLKRGSKRPKDPKDKEILFNGLAAVVAKLCEFEGITDVMDISRIFNYTAISNQDTKTFLSKSE
tara:strand:+ start:31099 stop:31566 length:468 start_codon:yes stop_codon:yes gene_type:complete